MRSRFDPRWQLLVAIVLLPCLLLPFALFGMLSATIFESGLLPQYEARAEVAGRGLQKRVEYGVTLFGTIEELRDVDESLLEALQSSDELAFVALATPGGDVIAHQPAAFAIEETLGLLGQGASSDGEFFSISGAVDGLHQALFGQPLFVARPENSRRINGYLITTVPVGAPDEPLANVHIGLEIEDFREIRTEVFFDTGSVFIATVLVAAECLILLWVMSIAAPMQIRADLAKRLAENDVSAVVPVGSHGWSTELVRRMNAYIRDVAGRARLQRRTTGFRLPRGAEPEVVSYSSRSDIRLPLFLFCLGEGLLRPSMPGHLADLRDTFGIGGAEQAGIAVAAFFLMTLAGVIGSRGLIIRLGQRAVFLLGALVGAAGILSHVLAETGIDGMGARALSGLGYGLVFGAAQAFVAARTPKSRKFQGLSLFVVVVVAAEIAGPAVGGVIVDQFGMQRMLTFAAAVASLSLVAAYLTLPSRRGGIAPPPVKLFQGGLILSDLRLLMMMLCFSMPTRILMTGGLFVLVPFAAADLGASATETGRILMCSGLALFASASLVTVILKRSESFSATVFAGATVSGLAFVLPMFVEGLVGMFVAVFFYGLGHSITILAQPGFLARTQNSRATKTGMEAVSAQFQGWERLGAFVGPIIAAVLLAFFSPVDGLFVMGTCAFLAMGIGAAYFLASGDTDEDEEIDGLFVQR